MRRHAGSACRVPSDPPRPQGSSGSSTTPRALRPAMESVLPLVLLARSIVAPDRTPLDRPGPRPERHLNGTNTWETCQRPGLRIEDVGFAALSRVRTTGDRDRSVAPKGVRCAARLPHGLATSNAHETFRELLLRYR